MTAELEGGGAPSLAAAVPRQTSGPKNTQPEGGATDGAGCAPSSGVGEASLEQEGAEGEGDLDEDLDGLSRREMHTLVRPLLSSSTIEPTVQPSV